MWATARGSVGSAAWTLVVLLPAVRLRTDVSPRVQRWIGGYLAAVAVLFALLWLRDIVPALLDDGTPGSLAGLAMITNPVEVLDFAFSIPAALVAAALLWRGCPAGLLRPLTVFLRGLRSPLMPTRTTNPEGM